MRLSRTSRDASTAAWHEINLVQQNDVSEGNLFARFLAVVEVLPDMQGVHHRNDAIQSQLALHFIVDEKCLDYRPWIGQTGGFDHNVIEAILTFHEIAEDTNESPRTVQQMQPLFISKISSSAPMTRA